MPEHQTQTETSGFIVKTVGLKKTIVLLVLFTIFSITCIVLNGNSIYLYQFKEGSSTSTIMFYLVFIGFCIVGYCMMTLTTFMMIRIRKGTNNEVSMLARLFKTLSVIVALFGAAFVLGKLSEFGTAITAFSGMMLGWSLQAPVSGIAAWIMVTLIRPYKIGDRINLPNYALMGDIIKFSPMYLTLNQVGGSVGSEEPSGRILHIPNATLFSAMIINTTYQQKQSAQSYILDEVVFRVTLDSDWDTAESIILNAARFATADIILATGKEPYVRAETWDYGTIFRVRYMTDATDRPKFSHQIAKMATKEFQTNKNVDLTIPYLYSFKRGVTSAATSNDRPQQVIRLNITEIGGGDVDLGLLHLQNQQEIDEIAKSVMKRGLLQPIVVTRNLNEEGYIVLLGEKRLLACKQLGWEKISCLVSNPIGTQISVPPVSAPNNSAFIQKSDDLTDDIE